MLRERFDKAQAELVKARNDREKATSDCEKMNYELERVNIQVIDFGFFHKFFEIFLKISHESAF